MKTQLILITMLSMALVMVEFTSCKKEENSLTAGDYLTQGTWLYSSIKVEPGIDMGDGYPVTEMYPYIEDCQKDNTLNFIAKSGTVYMDAGSTKCDPNEPQTMHAGYWNVSNNSTINISGPYGDSILATIQTLNETRFIYTYQIEDTDEQGNPVTYTYTVSMVSQ